MVCNCWVMVGPIVLLLLYRMKSSNVLSAQCTEKGEEATLAWSATCLNSWHLYRLHKTCFVWHFHGNHSAEWSEGLFRCDDDNLDRLSNLLFWFCASRRWGDLNWNSRLSSPFPMGTPLDHIFLTLNTWLPLVFEGPVARTWKKRPKPNLTGPSIAVAQLLLFPVASCLTLNIIENRYV
jgi:hypothetical protein